jgi:putative effector of murein hydrolase
MKEFLQSEIFLLLFTFAVFFAAQALQKRVKILPLNPSVKNQAPS